MLEEVIYFINVKNRSHDTSCYPWRKIRKAIMGSKYPSVTRHPLSRLGTEKRRLWCLGHWCVIIRPLSWRIIRRNRCITTEIFRDIRYNTLHIPCFSVRWWDKENYQWYKNYYRRATPYSHPRRNNGTVRILWLRCNWWRGRNDKRTDTFPWAWRRYLKDSRDCLPPYRQCCKNSSKGIYKWPRWTPFPCMGSSCWFPEKVSSPAVSLQKTSGCLFRNNTWLSL